MDLLHAPRCRGHHQIKQTPGWSVTQHPDGCTTWTTPTSDNGPKSLPEALKATDLPYDADYAWVAGESSMIKSVRRHLVNAVGMPKAAISFQGYWKRGEAQV